MHVGEVGDFAPFPQSDFLHVRGEYAQARIDYQPLEIQAEVVILAGGYGKAGIPLHDAQRADILRRGARGRRLFRCTPPSAPIFSGGVGSSSHIRLYFSSARASPMAACTP